MKWILLIILFILATTSVIAECADSDGGKNKYEFGTVIEGENTYEDKCSDDNIKEYFCGVDNTASYTVLPCVNGCEDSQCKLANEPLKSLAPETASNYKLYFYSIIGILIIIGYIYLFKIRNKKPKNGFIKRKHNLEEY